MNEVSTKKTSTTKRRQDYTFQYLQVDNVKKKTKNVKERTHNDMMLYVSVLEPLNRTHRDTEDEEKPYFSKRRKRFCKKWKMNTEKNYKKGSKNRNNGTCFSKQSCGNVQKISEIVRNWNRLRMEQGLNIRPFHLNAPSCS